MKTDLVFVCVEQCICVKTDLVFVHVEQSVSV